MYHNICGFRLCIVRRGFCSKTPTQCTVMAPLIALEPLGFLLFLVFVLDDMAGAGKGTPSACRGGLPIFIHLSAGTTTTFLLLFSDGLDSIPEQKCNDDCDDDIG